MNISQLTERTLEVSIEDATQDEVDRMTPQLLAELKASDVKSARLTKDMNAPTGSKGDTTTIGSIIIEFEGLAEELRNVLEKLDKGKGRR